MQRSAGKQLFQGAEISRQAAGVVQRSARKLLVEGEEALSRLEVERKLSLPGSHGFQVNRHLLTTTSGQRGNIG